MFTSFLSSLEISRLSTVWLVVIACARLVHGSGIDPNG